MDSDRAKNDNSPSNAGSIGNRLPPAGRVRTGGGRTRTSNTESRSAAVATVQPSPMSQAFFDSDPRGGIRYSDDINRDAPTLLDARGGLKIHELSQQKPPQPATVYTPDRIELPEIPPQNLPDFAVRPAPSPVPWKDVKVKPVPKYYPLEKSSVVLQKGVHEIALIAKMVSECFRALSLQAKYFNDPAAAHVLSPENVELYVAFWVPRSGDGGVVVEVQKRRGDAFTFHKYARSILSAAQGNFDVAEHAQHSVDLDCQYLKAAEELLRTECADWNAQGNEEKAKALKVVYNMLKKTRMDARISGMDSLCVLLDPRKSGIATSIYFCNVVLLGKAEGETNESVLDMGAFVRDFILSVIQTGRMGDEETLPKEDRMEVVYDSEDENVWLSDDENATQSPMMREVMMVMRNRALTAFSSALELAGNLDALDPEPENTSSASGMEDKKYAMVSEACEYAKGEKFELRDLSTSLVGDVGKARAKPHNACLGVKSLRYIHLATGSSIEQSDKEKIQSALEVGKSSHAKLEAECTRLLSIL